MNGAQEVETGFDFFLRVVSLNNGRDDGHVVALGTDIMGTADAGNVDIVLTTNLLLGQHNLNGINVARVGDGVGQETDGAHDGADLACLVGRIRGVANDLLGSDSLVTSLDGGHLAAVVIDKLTDRLIQHVGTAIDGTQSSKK